MKDAWNKDIIGNSEEGFSNDNTLKEVDGSVDAGEEESLEEGTNSKDDRKLLLALAFFLGMMCIAIFSYIIWESADHSHTDRSGFEPGNGYVTSSTMEEAETEIDAKPENGMENTNALTEQNEKPANDDADTAGNTDSVSDAGWEQSIFGQIPGGSLSRMISVKGITDEMVGEQGFLQTAFVKAAGSFLSANGIRASSISFIKPVVISTKDAFGYEADIFGDEGYSMIVIWYRSFPGRYILSIIQKDKQEMDEANDRTGQETRRSASGPSGSEAQVQPPSDATGQNTQQGDQQQNLQNATPQVQTVPETVQINPASNQNSQSSYDATALSIRSIPEPLLNYISNRYDFQYSLYDFLYRNGHRSVTKATVTGYTIDADRRIALIELNLDDGGQISATYYHDTNVFSFTG